ncbi:MAG: YkvA family protein [Novosphingobium sp.]
MIAQLREWAGLLKREVLVLWLAARDPRVPWVAKLLAGLVAGYALSPIDLIPDFIPVLGLLDDLLIVPAGIWLTLRLVPPDLLAELREAAAARAWPKPSRAAAGAIAAVWLLGVAVVTWWWLRPAAG